MSAAVVVNAPVAGKGRSHARGAGGEGVAVEKGEVGGHEVGSIGHTY